MTLSETKRLMAIIKAAQPRFETGGITAQVWHKILEDQALIDMETALYRHFRTNKFPPAPSELLSQTIPSYPTALEAWGEVRNRIRRVGYYGSPKFTHPIIKLAVDAIGWQVLCDMTEPDVMRSNFMRLYDTQCHRGVERTALGEIPAELEPGGFSELTDGIVKDMDDDKVDTIKKATVKD